MTTAATPHDLASDALVAQMSSRNEQLSSENRRLTDENRRLREQVAELEDAIGQLKSAAEARVAALVGALREERWEYTCEDGSCALCGNWIDGRDNGHEQAEIIAECYGHQTAARIDRALAGVEPAPPAVTREQVEREIADAVESWGYLHCRSASKYIRSGAYRPAVATSQEVETPSPAPAETDHDDGLDGWCLACLGSGVPHTCPNFSRREPAGAPRPTNCFSGGAKRPRTVVVDKPAAPQVTGSPQTAEEWADAIFRAPCQLGVGVNVSELCIAAHTMAIAEGVMLAAKRMAGEPAPSAPEQACGYCDGKGRCPNGGLCIPCEGSGAETALHNVLCEVSAVAESTDDSMDVTYELRGIVQRAREGRVLASAPPPTEEPRPSGDVRQAIAEWIESGRAIGEWEDSGHHSDEEWMAHRIRSWPLPAPQSAAPSGDVRRTCAVAGCTVINLDANGLCPLHRDPLPPPKSSKSDTFARCCEALNSLGDDKLAEQLARRLLDCYVDESAAPSDEDTDGWKRDPTDSQLIRWDERNYAVINGANLDVCERGRVSSMPVAAARALLSRAAPGADALAQWVENYIVMNCEGEPPAWSSWLVKRLAEGAWTLASATATPQGAAPGLPALPEGWHAEVLFEGLPSERRTISDGNTAVTVGDGGGLSVSLFAARKFITIPAAVLRALLGIAPPDPGKVSEAVALLRGAIERMNGAGAGGWVATDKMRAALRLLSPEES